MAAGAKRTRLGSGERFEIRRKLGAGGMGAVYRAYDRERKIEVALKSLLKADPRALYRFKREFRALADVVHPNLVNLYELHTVGDEWFFTMELIEGQPFIHHVRPYVGAPIRADAYIDPKITENGTVTDTSETRTTGVFKPMPAGRERVVRGALDLARLDRALYQLVDGVVALHRAGKLHRDLKPSNVLVEYDGRVVLLDFGLTSDLASMDEEYTHDTLAVGTPLYMSPEQAADVPLTEASDWYSVGVMLYEALTGRRPFEDSGEQIFLHKQLHDPAPPSQLQPETPARLDQLCMKLLARDPRKRPTGDEILATLDRRPSRATLQLDTDRQSTAFVGRQDELAALRGALEDSRLGGSVAVFVSGLSGMGKTALVRRFLREVEGKTDAIVLEGCCYERESVPYKALDAVVDALTRHLLALDPDDLRRVLPRDIMALARLFPTLRRVPAIAEPEVRGFEPPDPQELRRRAFGALRYLLKQLALRRPVVLYVDDLQWGDADSASFLADLVYHPAPPALLMILSYRKEDEAASPLISALRHERPVAAGGEVRDIRLGPLPDDEAVALVRELGGGGAADSEVAAQLAREAQGSPLFLGELARMSALDSMAGGTGEMTVEDILRLRIAGLEPAARELLEVTSLAGIPMEPDLLLTAAGVTGEGVELATLRAESLVRSRLAANGRSLIEPYHDRVRVVVRDALSSEGRASVHRRIADALERHGDADPATLLEHWSCAGDPGKIGRYARDAARAAVAALAFHRAAELYALALEHLDLGADDRRTMRTQYGHVLANAGRLSAAADAFAAAAADAATEDQRLELGRLELDQRLRNGDLERGIAKAEEVLGAVDLSLPRTHRRAMMSILFARARLRLRGLEFARREADQIPPRELKRLDVCWSASSALSFVEPFVGRALQMKFLRLALDTGEPSHVAQAFCLELGYQSFAGEKSRERVERLRERGLALAREAGDSRTEGVIESAGGLASFLSGRWREASRRMRAGEKLMRRSTDTRWALSVCEFFYTGTLVYLGQLAELGHVLPIYLREAEDRGDVYTVRGLKSWRSNIWWLIADRPDEARAMLDSVAVGGVFHLHHYYQLLSGAQIDMYRGAGDDAWRAVENDWKSMKRTMLLRIQTVRIEMLFLRARAALASLDHGDRGAKLAAADDCARRLEREGIAWSRALAAMVRAGRAAATGDEDGSVVALWNAVEELDASDMALHAACARQRLSQLIAGDEGARLADEVSAWMRRENVVAPEKLVQLFAPGF